MANKALFPLGKILATPGVLEALGRWPLDLLQRHVRGDWGDLSEEDRLANWRALRDGARIFSAYNTRGRDGKPVRVWVITEADRSATTVLLPDEY